MNTGLLPVDETAKQAESFSAPHVSGMDMASQVFSNDPVADLSENDAIGEEMINDQEDPVHAVKVKRYLGFKLDTAVCGIDVGHVKLVLKNQRITRVPGAVEPILGLIQNGGSIITVIDPWRFLGLVDHRMHMATIIVIIQVNEQQLGLAIDKFPRIFKIIPEHIESADPQLLTTSNHCIQGYASDYLPDEQATDREEPLLILDVNALVNLLIM